MGRLALILLLCGCANWTPADTQRQIAITALHGIDWAQTRSAVGDDRFEEVNPILGSDPTRQQVDLFMGVGLVALTVFPMLTSERYRPLVQWIFIGVKGLGVANNYRIGVRF